MSKRTASWMKRSDREKPQRRKLRLRVQRTLSKTLQDSSQNSYTSVLKLFLISRCRELTVFVVASLNHQIGRTRSIRPRQLVSRGKGYYAAQCCVRTEPNNQLRSLIVSYSCGMHFLQRRMHRFNRLELIQVDELLQIPDLH